MENSAFGNCKQQNGNFMVLFFWLIESGFNDTSTLVGHFVSSPRETEKRDRRGSRGNEREGQRRKEDDGNNGNLPAAQINYVIIQTLSKNQHFTDLCAVNKRLTRIISNGSLIINPFVWHVWIHWDCKTSRCSRRVQKIKGRFTESDKRMHRLNAPVFFLFFFV